MTLDLNYIATEDRMCHSIRGQGGWLITRSLLLKLVAAWLEKLQSIDLPPVGFSLGDRDIGQEHALSLENEMLKDPEAGDVITGTGGLRKLRYGDATRGKGKRGGLRVIYYWWDPKKQFWLFTIYDKDELSDLSPKEKAMLKTLLKKELEERK